MIVGVEKKLELSMGRMTVEIPNAKKVNLVSENTIISVLGYPHRVTDLYKYLLNLKGTDNSYDEIIEDLKSIFENDQSVMAENAKEVKKYIKKFTAANGELDIENLLKAVEFDPDSKSLIEEILVMAKGNLHSPVSLFIFSRESGCNRYGRSLFLGNTFKDHSVDRINDDYIVLGFGSVKKSLEEVDQIEKDLLDDLKEKMTHGWEEEPSATELLIENSLDSITKGLEELSIYDDPSDIIFYELSERTNYKWKEPAIKLTPIQFNRAT